MTDALPIAPDTLTAGHLARAFIYATDWLGVFVEEINALNVYPVPDGDTGTNMHLTMQSLRRQLAEGDPKSMRELAHALAYRSLMGARGNSGVILSQVFKGFAEVAKGCEVLGPKGLRAALAGAAKSAYAAVVKPVEGTILTVVRRAAEAAGASGASRPLDLLREASSEARRALEQTPDMLPLLKQAGVVDAGGLGFLRILEGILAYFEGRELPVPPRVTSRAQEQFQEEEFGFCTEFLLSGVTVSTRRIQEVVTPFGESLLVVGAEGFVKGHIHTEEPERLLATVARFGKMVRSKVEDMSEQHSEILASASAQEVQAPLSALVAVSAGYGLTRAFRGFGARVVGGGQTNNPSVQEIADAVRSVEAEQVLVLPNNKNIVLAAERVAEVVSDKMVRVLPTTTLGQGLAAAVMFQDDRPVADLYAEMAAAAAGTLTIEVTTASRRATVGGVAVEEGDFIGLLDNELRVSGATPEGVLETLLAEVIEAKVVEDVEVATLFFSAALGAEAAGALVETLESRYPELEIECHAGAPDLYAYVMVLE